MLQYYILQSLGVLVYLYVTDLQKVQMGTFSESGTLYY